MALSRGSHDLHRLILGKHEKNSHLISISCWILLRVLSDSLSKLFGGLYDTFP